MSETSNSMISASSDKNLHKGHRSRLIRRFMENGIDTFEPHNILELLLFYAIPHKDTNPLAHRLIQEYGSVADVMRTDWQTLQHFPALGPYSATFLNLLPDIADFVIRTNRMRSQRHVCCDSAEGVKKWVREVFGGTRTPFTAIACLNNRREIVFAEKISPHTPTDPAFRYDDVSRIFIRHNSAFALLISNTPEGEEYNEAALLESNAAISSYLYSQGIQLLDHFVLDNGVDCRYLPIPTSYTRNDRYGQASSLFDDFEAVGCHYTKKHIRGNYLFDDTAEPVQFLPCKEHPERDAKRLTERYRQSGLADFDSTEVLTLLLSFASHSSAIPDIAAKLINTHARLGAVLSLPPHILNMNAELTPYIVSLLRLTLPAVGFAHAGQFPTRRFSALSDIGEYLTDIFLGASKEYVYLLMMDEGRRLIKCLKVNEGTVDRVDVLPRRLVEIALSYGAASCVMAHNHPSGTVFPSTADILTTDTVREQFRAAGIEFIDQFIVSDNRYLAIDNYRKHEQNRGRMTV